MSKSVNISNICTLKEQVNWMLTLVKVNIDCECDLPSSLSEISTNHQFIALNALQMLCSFVLQVMEIKLFGFQICQAALMQQGCSF